MKKDKQKTQASHTSALESVIEQHVEDRHNASVLKHKKYALRLSKMNLTGSIKQHTQEIALDYQDPIDFLHTTINTELHELQQHNDVTDTEEQQAELERDIEDLEMSIKVKEDRLNESAAEGKQVVEFFAKRIAPIIFIFGGLEVFMNIQTFNIFGLSFFGSLALGFMTFLLLVFWIHVTVKALKFVGDKQWRYKIGTMLVMSIPIIFLYTLLADTRIAYLSLINPRMTGIYVSSTLLPILLQSLVFFIAVYLVYQYFPDKETRMQYGRYQSGIRELKDLKKELQELRDKRNALKPELRNKQFDNTKTLLFARQMERKIEHKMKECFLAFKNEMLMLTNGKVSHLFSEDIADDLHPLELYYQTQKKTVVNHSLTKAVVVVAAAFFLGSCSTMNNQASNTISLTILDDTTDKEIAEPTIEDIQAVVPADTDAELQWTYSQLNNSEHNEVYIMSLEEHSFMDNELERKVAMEYFYQNIDSVLLSEKDKKHHYTKSNIYVPLVDHLTKVAQEATKTKIVLLYSDAIENSDTYNLYQKQAYQKMLNDPASVVATFIARRQIPDLDGVQLYIIHYPKSEKEDKLFTAMVDFYRKHLFKESGLTIHIGLDKNIQIK